ncbi:hypothetical protein [Larkinella arboricola]
MSDLPQWVKDQDDDLPIPPPNGMVPPVLENEELEQINQRALELDRQGQALYIERQEVLRRQRKAQEAHVQKLKQQRQELREQAVHYRALASEATEKKEADKFLAWAIDSEEKARAIVIEGEEPEAAAPVLQPKLPAWRSIRVHRMVALVQVVGLFLVAGWCLGMFDEMRVKILEHNKALPIEQQAQPYDLTSLQKYFYELFISFLDVPMSFIKLLLIAPFVLYYLLPFVKTGKKDFITEFFEELTPYQRCVLTVILLALCFFSVSWAHVVKP